jgi:hypothetical protein
MSRAAENVAFYMVYLALCESGYAWVETRTKTQARESCDLTTRDKLYQPLLSVAQFLPEESEAFVFTDSLLLRRGFNRFRSPDEIITVVPSFEVMALQTIEEKGIKMYVEKVKRGRNPARKLLAASRKSD